MNKLINIQREKELVCSTSIKKLKQSWMNDYKKGLLQNTKKQESNRLECLSSVIHSTLFAFRSSPMHG